MLSANRGEFLITSHGFNVMQEQQLSDNPVTNIIIHYSYTKNLYIPPPLRQVLKWSLQKMYKPGTTIQASSQCTNFTYTNYSVTQSPDSIYELRHLQVIQ